MEHPKVKCILIGDSSTGKSYFLKKLQKDYIFVNHYEPTIGVDFTLFKYHKDNLIQNVSLWDLAGDPRFNCIIETYLRKNNLFLLFCNKYDLKSISNLHKWIEKIRQNNNYEQKFFISIICYDFNTQINPIEYKINNLNIYDYLENFGNQFSEKNYINGTVYHLDEFSNVKNIIKSIVNEYRIFLDNEPDIISNNIHSTNVEQPPRQSIFSCIFNLFSNHKYNNLNP